MTTIITLIAHKSKPYTTYYHDLLKPPFLPNHAAQITITTTRMISQTQSGHLRQPSLAQVRQTSLSSHSSPPSVEYKGTVYTGRSTSAGVTGAVAGP